MAATRIESVAAGRFETQRFRQVITVLTGGVGGARYLAGQISAVPPEQVTALVNVADDVEMHGLHVSPDIDTVIYTLAGVFDDDRGWGLEGDTQYALTEMRELGLDAWFNLGDRDIGTHLFRTTLLGRGASLSEVTARLAEAHGLACRVLPVSDDPVRTRMLLASGTDTGFQEYFVRLAHEAPITGVRFVGADRAKPAPGVVHAIDSADTVVIAPSNPVVSIGPILAVPGVSDALAARRDRNVAVSPIIAGAALRGPAARMMSELGEEASVIGVARRYREVVGILVIDEADAALASAVEAVGVRAVVAPTVMRSPEAAAGVAHTAMAAAAAGSRSRP